MSLILFDLDGTLIDSELGIVTSIEYALGKLGATVPPRDVLRTWIGPPLRATFPLVLGDDTEAVERAVTLYRQRFATIGWREHTIYPGIGEIVGLLAARGNTLAVITSKPNLYAGKIVASLPFAAHFARVYSVAPESGVSEKAEMIAQALIDFAAVPSDTTMVGDRHFDIEGARANGVRAIGAAWGFGAVEELRLAGADVIVDTPAALSSVL